MSEFIVDRENIWPYGSQREEIVRCKDCKLWKDDCEWNRFYNDLDLDEPDGFCAWAVKRTGVENG